MCDSFGGEGDPCAVWNERQRTARKEHTCDGCGARIRLGEKYVDHRSIVERGERPCSDRMCLACRDDREALSEAHDGELFPMPSFLRETVQHCIRDGGADSEARWRPMLERIDARKAAA